MHSPPNRARHRRATKKTDAWVRPEPRPIPPRREFDLLTASLPLRVDHSLTRKKLLKFFEQMFEHGLLGFDPLTLSAAELEAMLTEIERDSGVDRFGRVRKAAAPRKARSEP